jgi:hypothetical protein
MQKTFCIAGPIIEEDHYFIPQRLNRAVWDQYIEGKFYFLLHAPRQSGKTSAIREYARHINEEGKFSALYMSTEPAHIAANDIERTVYWLLTQLARQVRIQLPHEKAIYEFAQSLLKQSPIIEDAFYQFLEYWSENSLKPIILFFDEVDGLVEKSLVFLLKQLRTGYVNRPAHFPQSVCLIGVRNLQDYKLQSIDEKEKGVLLSPFNIVADSVVLENFTRAQVGALYEQHTKETGQSFTEEALDTAYCLTQGQPWLVNALAYQACFRDVTDRAQLITKEIIEKAKDQLIARRDTHISALVDRLYEPRVRDIIDAIISGSDPTSFNPDDIEYVRDLGLLKDQSWEIANPIYQQVIPRALTYVLQEILPFKTSWYLDAAGNLDMKSLLKAFTQFFRENAEAYSKKLEYRKSFPHLLLMAFMQRIINGGGKIHREYALGRKRVDLLIEWKTQRIIIELKVKRGSDTLEKGLAQTADYVTTSWAHEAHRIIFDNDSQKSWDEKISDEVVIYGSKKIHVWTM